MYCIVISNVQLMLTLEDTALLEICNGFVSTESIGLSMNHQCFSSIKLFEV